jgi:hypothetical protein
MRSKVFAAVLVPALAFTALHATNAHAFTCSDTKLNKQTPIPFTPIPMQDPATGHDYLPNEEVQLGGGKTMLASDFFSQLNDLEQSLNAWGYTIRDADVHSLEEMDECIALLQAQEDAIKKDADKNPPSPFDLAARAQQLADKWKKYQDGLPSLDDLWANADSDAVKVNLPPPPPFSAPVPQAARVEPKDIFKKRTWSFETGDPSKFWVKGDATVEMQGSRELTKLDAAGHFNAAVMGMWNGEVASATAAAQAGKGIDPQLSLNVAILGQTVWNPTYPDPGSKPKPDPNAPPPKQLLHQNDKFAGNVDEGVDWRFAIGPIPCKARLGFRGSAGLEYGYDVALTAVGGFAGPFAKADAYVEAGVDIGVAGVGVEGDLVLLEDELTLRGDASLDFVDEPKVVLDLSASNDINALSGSFSVYAYIDLFFTSWRGEKKLWGWDGYKDHTDIFHFKYTWTPAGASADGDVQAEDLLDVQEQNHELAVAALENAANQKVFDVMKATDGDLSSPDVATVVREPVAASAASQSLDTAVNNYLTALQSWSGT